MSLLYLDAWGSHSLGVDNRIGGPADIYPEVSHVATYPVTLPWPRYLSKVKEVQSNLQRRAC